MFNIKNKLKSLKKEGKYGAMYMNTVVKIIACVVIGALLIGALAFTLNTSMNTASGKVESLFAQEYNYAGGSGSGGSNGAVPPGGGSGSGENELEGSGSGSGESGYEIDKLDWFSKIGDTSGSFWNEKGEVVYTTAQMAEDYPGYWDENCDYDAIALELIDTYGIVASNGSGGNYFDFDESGMPNNVALITDSIFLNQKIQIGRMGNGGLYADTCYVNSLTDLGLTLSDEQYNRFTVYVNQTMEETHDELGSSPLYDSGYTTNDVGSIKIGTLKVTYTSGETETITDLLKGGYAQIKLYDANTGEYVGNYEVK